ncbi:MAG: TetR family transcriptional regulator [Actinomycetota bacterium]
MGATSRRASVTGRDPASPGGHADKRAAKVAAILDAAMQQFSSNGYARTSMAAIAAAAGVSRPALYQFFENREDVFRSVLRRTFSDANRAALAELEAEGTMSSRLDGFLQRRFGDTLELVASMPHGAEIMDAHLSIAPDVGQAADRELRAGIEAFLGRGYAAADVNRAVDLLLFGPFGIKNDKPSLAVYRERLTTLADATAALLGPTPLPQSPPRP